jgi:hypothetical protein
VHVGIEKGDQWENGQIKDRLELNERTFHEDMKMRSRQSQKHGGSTFQAHIIRHVFDRSTVSRGNKGVSPTIQDRQQDTGHIVVTLIVAQCFGLGYLR